MTVTTAKQGKRVVRLKCGDPGVFARGAEEVDALTEAGIAYEIVPGVIAASAALATMGGFLTERGTSDMLVLGTGQSADVEKQPEWLTSLRPGMRIAVYRGIGTATEIAQNLTEASLSQHIQIDIVSRAQQTDQLVAHCNASRLVETIEINAPAILFLTWRQVEAQMKPALEPARAVR